MKFKLIPFIFFILIAVVGVSQKVSKVDFDLIKKETQLYRQLNAHRY